MAGGLTWLETRSGLLDSSSSPLDRFTCAPPTRESQQHGDGAA